MKIIFVFNTFYKSPFFYELGRMLQARGYEVEIYDLVSSCSYNLKSNKKESFKPFYGADIVLKIKGLRRLLIPLINRRTIEKNVSKNDIVNFHYVDKRYAKYSDLFVKKTKNIVTTFWGSDLLRGNIDTLEEYLPLLENSKIISMVKGIQNSFKKTYPKYTNKLRTTMFGLSILDEIKKVEISDEQNFKLKHNLKDNKIYITVGYNGSPAQQHEKLLLFLNNLKKDYKDKIFLLIPFTYGGNEDYKLRVLKLIEESDLEYKAFFKFLSHKELAILRCVSDITLNIQKTDAFSASISESLVARNIVLVGDWLPYEIYKSWGVTYFKSSLDCFTKSIEKILNNYNHYKDSEMFYINSDTVYERLRWEEAINLWVSVYEELNSFQTK